MTALALVRGKTSGQLRVLFECFHRRPESVCELTRRHRRMLRVVRVLHDGDAAEAFDRDQSCGAVVERAAQHDADRAAAIDVRRTAEQRIDRGTMSIFTRSAHAARNSVALE